MEYKVILIQGAMNIEIEYLINQLKEKEKIAIAEYEFYKGTISNKISKKDMNDLKAWLDELDDWASVNRYNKCNNCY